jgi:uncharacterized protein (DUF58 family)
MTKADGSSSAAIAAARELLDPSFAARLERLELHVRRLVAGVRRGDSIARRRGAGAQFRGHRDYVAGDDPRFIDWNAFLRFGEVVVKEFDAEEAPRLTLFPDLSASLAVGDGAKFAQTLRLCAALGYVALARHVPVRLAPLPSQSGLDLDGHGRATALLAALAQLRPAPKTEFLRPFSEASSSGRAPGVAIVLSDFYDLEEYAVGLKLLRRRGYQVEALHLVDAEDLRPRCDGPTILRDVETGRSTRVQVDAALRERYRAVVVEHLADVSARCRASGVGYRRIDARKPIETVVFELLYDRGLLK